ELREDGRAVEKAVHVAQHGSRLAPVRGDDRQRAALAGCEDAVVVLRRQPDRDERGDTALPAAAAGDHPGLPRNRVHAGAFPARTAPIDGELGRGQGETEKRGQERPPGLPRRPVEVPAEQRRRAERLEDRHARPAGSASRKISAARRASSAFRRATSAFPRASSRRRASRSAAKAVSSDRRAVATVSATRRSIAASSMSPGGRWILAARTRGWGP